MFRSDNVDDRTRMRVGSLARTDGARLPTFYAYSHIIVAVQRPLPPIDEGA